MKIFSRQIDRWSMSQMSAVIKVHSHDRIARCQHRKLNCHISLRSWMRLYIYILTAKQFFCAFSCQFFGNIHTLTASVISLARISFCIFICKRTSHRCHHCFAHPVLRSDQFNMGVLSLHFRCDHFRNLRICIFDFIEVVHRHYPPSHLKFEIWNFINLHFTMTKR